MAADLERLAARLFVAGFPGAELDGGIRRLLGRGLGGVILFSRNLDDWPQVIELVTAILRAGGGRVPLVSIDQEGGRVQRLGPPFLQLPPARVLARGGAALCRRAGHQLGLELRAAGIWLDFAPVLDVDSNPRNPVIADRSFGADPAQAARLALAFALGLRQAGVGTCGKHFPGHGDTAGDSHHELPRLEHQRERLERVEIKPFRMAVPAVTSMMMAHLLVPVLDAAAPTSLSAAAYRLLRRELGFSGLVFTDDVEMAAVARDPGPVEAAVRAIAAGADAVLVCHRPELVEQAIAETVRRVERGVIPRHRLEEANARWQRLERDCHAGRLAPEPERLRQLFDSAPRRRLEEDLERLAAC